MSRSSAMEFIGEVHDLKREFYFEWRIKDFFSLRAENGECHESPSFTFAGESWYLGIYPNGESWNNSIGSVGVYLFRESSGSSIRLSTFWGLKTFDGKKGHVRQFTHTFEKVEGWGLPKFCNRSLLSKKKAQLVPFDILTLFCDLKFENDADAKFIDDGTNEKLLEDLANLIDNEEHSDITIRVKGEEFRLHRNILAGRNPYFSSMFKTEMKEKITGIVTVDDCEPDIFQSFISFVYTGKAHPLSCDNVCALYEVADKYQEDQLKAQCLSYMRNEISVDSFCDFFVLALQHDVKWLRKYATEFFCRERKKIIRSVKWQTFMREYPEQTNQLHIKSLE